MTNPTPTPETPAQAAARILELVSLPFTSMTDEVIRAGERASLAPILARAYVEEHPPLVWRECESVLPAMKAMTCYQMRVSPSIPGWGGPSVWIMPHDKYVPLDSGILEIACHRDTGTPWPMKPMEVGE